MNIFQLFFMALLANIAFNPSLASALDSNHPAPDFQVTDISGAPQSINQYKGKIVVLEWTNPECPFVKKHYGSGNMQQLQKYAVSKNIVWLSINSSAPGKEGNMDNAQAQANVAQAGAHPTAYILDPSGKIGQLYGAKTTPHMFVIDARGVLVYQGAIDDIASTEQDDIKKAHNYVKIAIDDLLAGKPIATASTRAYGCSVKY